MLPLDPKIAISGLN